MALEDDVYRTLLKHLRQAPVALPTLTYTQLAAKIPGFTGGHRSPKLHEALGEVVQRCHSKKLGALPALAINKKLNRPGPGYYPMAHGPQPTAAAERRVWDAELLRVIGDTKRYPAALP